MWHWMRLNRCSQVLCTQWTCCVVVRNSVAHSSSSSSLHSWGVFDELDFGRWSEWHRYLTQFFYLAAISYSSWEKFISHKTQNIFFSFFYKWSFFHNFFWKKMSHLHKMLCVVVFPWSTDIICKILFANQANQKSSFRQLINLTLTFCHKYYFFYLTFKTTPST